MKNLKIGHKLGATFLLLILLLIVVAGIGLSGISKSFESSRKIYNNSVIPLATIAEIEYLMLRNRVLVMDMIINGNPENVAKRSEEHAKNTKKVDASWKTYTESNLTTREKELVKEFEFARANYLSLGITPIRDAIKSGKKEEAETLYKERLSKYAPKVFETLAELTKVQVELATSQLDLSAGVNRTVNAITIGATLATVLLSVFLAWWITRLITQPLHQAVLMAKAVASGDLTSHIEVRSKDEIGQLIQALNDMNDSLVNIVFEVRTSTDTIATGSGQIASGNLDLSSRTEQQASSLEETASSMEELTSTVKQNADNARQANQMAISASEVATEGGIVVSQVVNTMDSINASSKKIVDIIGVIDGIAFQTNILALNAAVEAARAGEQGRGFAVVASEVRNLAQRSAAAAKEIKVLIDDSVNKVGVGAKLVDQAGSTMQAIVDSVKSVTDIMLEITAASQEQTSGIEQINQAITNMDEVTQQNAALVEEVAAAASSLEDQANKLTQVVSVFKIETTSGSKFNQHRSATNSVVATGKERQYSQIKHLTHH